MASNKDILNAQRFNRRRLVTAFISGTPGGRELESKSFVPPLIGGIVISLLMLGIAFAMGKFSPTLPDNWQNNTLIIVKGTGARYYSVQGVLHPIYNVTSARMRTPAGSLQTVSVGEKVIAGIPRGDAIGEPEAPD
ncbi:MAG: type VII secretion protein EccB, partial [Actinomyces sp.]|nr:type VII secretion protein EccB [Actinomyces sp.]